MPLCPLLRRATQVTGREPPVSSREAAFLALLCHGHSRTTAVDLTGVSRGQVAQLTRTYALMFNDRDRLVNPANTVSGLAAAVKGLFEQVHQLRAALAAAIHPVGAPSAKDLGVPACQVRAWARDLGVPVNGMGRLDTAVLAAYAAAHRGRLS